jgi:GNAT superfamily N-acetyltransferase
MRIHIRLARPADSPELARMRYDFRAKDETVAEKKTVFVRRCDRWMKKRLAAAARWRCWVAEAENELIGNIWVEVIEKIPNPVVENELHAYITNFYVVADARGQQIGSKLLREALGWCETKKVDAIILWPSKRSRTLYLRHGFVTAEKILQLRQV